VLGLFATEMDFSKNSGREHMNPPIVFFLQDQTLGTVYVLFIEVS